MVLLGIGGLAVSLAAQDTISDMINGVIILLDQPFRINDRIGVHELDTWGDVRVETEIHIAYGSDIDQARGIILDTVRDVDGVLPSKPVEALFIEFGDSAIKILVRWWIHSFTDTRSMFDGVHSALYKALGQAGVEMPFTTFDLNLQMRPAKTTSQTKEVDKDQGQE
jgi:small-conductance mechanosensitive channel